MNLNSVVEHAMNAKHTVVTTLDGVMQKTIVVEYHGHIDYMYSAKVVTIRIKSLLFSK